jgi:LysM repeat protein
MVWGRRCLSWAFALFVSLAFAQDVIVQPGDSLWSIAQRHETTVAALMEANGLTGDALNPGHVLRLPTTATVNPDTYVVQAGDSPYSIAMAFGLSLDELIAINNLDGHIIRVGQVLRLTPSTADTPAIL